MHRRNRLTRKKLAVLVVLGNKPDNGIFAEAFCSELRENGARIVGDQLYAGSPDWNLNNWVCAISPNL